MALIAIPVPGGLRLGVFGGAFDPPHAGHRALVEAALTELQLDRLRVFPTGQAWHKKRELSGAAHRVAMAELAFADLPRVRVDARETLRPGPTYSVETLRELHAEHPGATLYLVIGQDQAADLQRWHAWREVVQLAIICVAARAQSTGAATGFVPPAGLEPRFLRLSCPLLPVSATEIRRRAATGQSIVPLVGDAVARYIADHYLYQSA